MEPLNSGCVKETRKEKQAGLWKAKARPRKKCFWACLLLHCDLYPDSGDAKHKGGPSPPPPCPSSAPASSPPLLAVWGWGCVKQASQQESNWFCSALPGRLGVELAQATGEEGGCLALNKQCVGRHSHTCLSILPSSSSSNGKAATAQAPFRPWAPVLCTSFPSVSMALGVGDEDEQAWNLIILSNQSRDCCHFEPGPRNSELISKLFCEWLQIYRIGKRNHLSLTGLFVLFLHPNKIPDCCFFWFRDIHPICLLEKYKLYFHFMVQLFSVNNFHK